MPDYTIVFPGPENAKEQQARFVGYKVYAEKAPDGSWIVVDPAGRNWTPGPEALKRIAQGEHAGLSTLAVALDNPELGTWAPGKDLPWEME